ncbi:pilus assembly FimT family protein [Hazenella coriacea]|uniref:Prepilin-type N-terminal cleavage/methylation domain-containing protein n=1 Tax=Hazenella coriacea TaxID=1179467 RepID=A0A4R3L6Q2_9BACL|nr:type II secretion system protein [Hazenella coriacea]TCS94705.1 prepilin-type N-terminal cleavage/methylation domain-containing protein [Hazenella coriacea]
MKKLWQGEKGFTLPEMITGLFILGILVSFTIPLFSELKSQQLRDKAKGEALALLQGKIEKVREVASANGEEKVNSRNQSSLTYHLKWETKHPSSSLNEVKVEITWKDSNGKTQRYHLVTHYFAPSVNKKKDLLILN